jgi:hypothetical protein
MGTPSVSASAVGSMRSAGTEISAPTPARRPGHDEAEQPHSPEEEAAQLPGGPEAEAQERHVHVCDHPRYGLLNGLNYLGYCDTCPIGLRDPGALCRGPCPPSARHKSWKSQDGLRSVASRSGENGRIAKPVKYSAPGG